MQIDWWTLALQAINFLVLVWLLWRFLYTPVRTVIEKRKQLAERAFAEAAQKQADAEDARRRFEERRDELTQERQDMLKTMHEELETERSKILDEARSKADELLQTARDAIDQEREAAFADVREQIAELAAELAARLLQGADSEMPGDFFLEQLEKQLKELPAEERERLQNDLAADGARLTVVTAAPLTPREQDKWMDQLDVHVGQRDKTDFIINPNILGGAELRFPHAVIKFTWADQLTKAKELLRRDEITS